MSDEKTDRLLAAIETAKEVMRGACVRYCKWYDQDLVFTSASDAAYALVTDHRRALAILNEATDQYWENVATETVEAQD